MRYTKITLALLTVLPTAALADFRIFLGGENDAGSGGGRFSILQLLNNPPSCDDLANSLVLLSNGEDANGGWNCDGCGTGTPPTWIIDRLEINNAPAADGSRVFPNLPDRLTLYGSGGGNYNPIFGDAAGSQDGSIGNCFRTPENPEVVCAAGIGSSVVWDSIFCTTAEPLGSGVSGN